MYSCRICIGLFYVKVPIVWRRHMEELDVPRTLYGKIIDSHTVVKLGEGNVLLYIDLSP